MVSEAPTVQVSLGATSTATVKATNGLRSPPSIEPRQTKAPPPRGPADAIEKSIDELIHHIEVQRKVERKKSRRRARLRTYYDSSPEPAPESTWTDDPSTAEGRGSNGVLGVFGVLAGFVTNRLGCRADAGSTADEPEGGIVFL